MTEDKAQINPETSELSKQTNDLLDMSRYTLNKLPKKERSNVEKWMSIIGAPLAIIVFILLNFFAELPFLQNINPESLNEKARII